MNITTREFNQEERYAISTAFKKFGLCKLRLVDYGHTLQVCKLWKEQMYTPTLEFFKILSFPLFKRFVSGMAQIDRTATPKYDVANNIIITQQNYEQQMILLATQAAVQGYSLFNQYDDVLTPQQVNQILNNANQVLSKYYEERTHTFPKNIYLPTDVNLFQFSDLKTKEMNLNCFLNGKDLSMKKHVSLKNIIETLIAFKAIPDIPQNDSKFLTSKPSIWKMHAKVVAKFVIVSSFLSFLVYKLNTLKNEAELRNDINSWKNYYGLCMLAIGSSILAVWWAIKTNLESFFLSKYDTNATVGQNLIWQVAATISRSICTPMTLIVLLVAYNFVSWQGLSLIFLGCSLAIATSFR